VLVSKDAIITDHECTLRRDRPYRLDEVDDFNRLRFFHQGCDHWHDPLHFAATEAEPW
jgi:hypothetical protein